MVDQISFTSLTKHQMHDMILHHSQIWKSKPNIIAITDRYRFDQDE
ncbi:hypothetical protein BLGI_3901 [Brevibacillus laterosporus GI-9]|nr:hypothetical protein BLGI_3901 [Brevibacillus laterosporus GI-9]